MTLLIKIYLFYQGKNARGYTSTLPTLTAKYFTIHYFPQSHCPLRTSLVYRQLYSQLLQVGSSCSTREGENKQT